MTEIATMTVSQLLELHDASVPEDRRLGRWRKDRRKAELLALVERVLEDSRAVRDASEQADVAPEEPGSRAPAHARTVKESALRALSLIVGRDADGRPLGLSYAQALRRVRSEHPDRAPTEKTMRWYRSQMNNGCPKHPILNDEKRLPTLGR